MEEYGISFYTIILEEEGYKELKKNDDVKGKNNFGLVIDFCRDTN